MGGKKESYKAVHLLVAAKMWMYVRVSIYAAVCFANWTGIVAEVKWGQLDGGGGSGGPGL